MTNLMATVLICTNLSYNCATNTDLSSNCATNVLPPWSSVHVYCVGGTNYLGRYMIQNTTTRRWYELVPMKREEREAVDSPPLPTVQGDK